MPLQWGLQRSGALRHWLTSAGRPELQRHRAALLWGSALHHFGCFWTETDAGDWLVMLQLLRTNTMR